MSRRFCGGLWEYRSVVLVVLTPLLLLPLPVVCRTKVADCAFVLLLMAVFWVTEVIPLSVTAMIPAVLFPLFGIMKSSEVARVYFKDFHFLLVGVICLATSIEKWGLHRRIALRLVTLVGLDPAWLMLGFMSGCAFLSMWVHNTSAVTMVMPIVEAVIQQVLKAGGAASGEENPALQLDETGGRDEKKEENVSMKDQLMCKALSVSIAYSSNIGGIATLPGTSPNLIFSQFIQHFRFLWRCRGERTEREKAAGRAIEEEYRALGPMSSQEVLTQAVFLLLVVLWLTRDPGFMPGWASLFPQYSGFTTDATVALLLGLLLFIVPARGPSHRFEPMISWQDFQTSMPWGVALLVGGGFALAEGTQVSGLSSWVAELLTPLGDLPVLATVAVACIIVTTVTEVASNAATITIFLPILAALAEAIQVNPLSVLIPTTLCTSFSFLLPASNPPNAVVFAYGHLNTTDMVKAGLGVNLIGLLAVLLAVTTWGVPLFSLDTYPDWAPVLPESNSTAP